MNVILDSKRLRQLISVSTAFMIHLWAAYAVSDVATLSKKQFHEFMRTHEMKARTNKKPRKLSELQLHRPFWGELHWLRPGQNRSSYTLSIQKIAKGAGKHYSLDYLSKDKHRQRYLKGRNRVLQHHSHRSLFSEKEIVPVALTRDGYIALDGTHDIQASWAVNAERIRMVATHDLRDYSLQEAYKLLDDEGVIYPYDENGDYDLPYYFHELRDDDNRLYAGYQILSVELNSKSEIVNTKIRGREEYPLAVKFSSGSRRHQELRLGDALRAGGFIFNPDTDDFTSEEFRESARQALVQAKKAQSNFLHCVYIVPFKLHKSLIPVQEYLNFHLGRSSFDPSLAPGCEVVFLERNPLR